MHLNCFACSGWGEWLEGFKRLRRCPVCGGSGRFNGLWFWAEEDWNEHES